MTVSRKDFDFPGAEWLGLQQVPPTTYICGFCDDKVSSKEGYQDQARALIRICPSCRGPTVFTATGKRCPSNAPGRAVAHVPPDIHRLYDEARRSAGAGAYTAAVMACRKMLMNIAVEQGAKEGKSFLAYVEHLADEGYVPPKGKVWVDYVRSRGNEANHEIALMTEEDAATLIAFVEMLLRFNYEFPNLVPAETETSAS